MYVKHGNLVDAHASGAKGSRKHLESRLEVIQGHAFGITEKAPPSREPPVNCGGSLESHILYI